MTTLLTEEAVRVVEEHDTSKPMFLELAYTAPHKPVRVPPSALQSSDPNEDRCARSTRPRSPRSTRASAR